MRMRAIFYPYLSLLRLVFGFAQNRKSQPASLESDWLTPVMLMPLTNRPPKL